MLQLVANVLAAGFCCMLREGNVKWEETLAEEGGLSWQTV
jgi:hypothetical protein